MICPRCKETLCEVKVDEILLDKCNSCGGVWFDFTEMERVIFKDARTLKSFLGNAKPHDQGASDEEDPLKCPRCSDELLPVRSAESLDIQIQACLTCYGRWLDGGEIGRVRDQGLFRKLKEVLKQLF